MDLFGVIRRLILVHGFASLPLRCAPKLAAVNDVRWPQVLRTADRTVLSLRAAGGAAIIQIRAGAQRYI